MRKKSEHRQAGHLADGVRARPVSWLPLQCADQCIVLFSLLQALAFHQEVNPEPHYQKSLWERASIKNWHSLMLELSIPQKRLFMRTSHLQNIRVGSNTSQSSSLASWLLPPSLTTAPCPLQTWCSGTQQSLEYNIFFSCCCCRPQDRNCGRKRMLMRPCGPAGRHPGNRDLRAHTRGPPA